MAALGTILFLQTPVAPTALVALFVLALPAWRLLAFLSDTDANRPDMTGEPTHQAGPSARER